MRCLSTSDTDTDRAVRNGQSRDGSLPVCHGTTPPAASSPGCDQRARSGHPCSPLPCSGSSRLLLLRTAPLHRQGRASRRRRRRRCCCQGRSGASGEPVCGCTGCGRGCACWARRAVGAASAARMAVPARSSPPPLSPPALSACAGADRAPLVPVSAVGRAIHSWRMRRMKLQSCRRMQQRAHTHNLGGAS